MRYYIITGEASGDLHAANLLKALKETDPQASFRGWGGDKMEHEGAVVVKHYRDLAFMGFAEVLTHLPTIFRNFRFCKTDILAFQPDVVILVDYPGFNLRMARFVKEHGIRVFYYISPQLWAWNSSRVKKIKRWVDRMFVILPFEKEFYASYDYTVEFQGHPLLDVINNTMQLPSRQSFLMQNNLPDQPIIALLPGSRKMEIGKLLRMMISVRKSFSGYQFVVAGAPSIDPAFYGEMLKDAGIKVVTGQTYALLQHAVAALVTSGTATLETGLMGIPQVVCYKGNFISYQIAKRLVKVKYISLVNLICDKRVVPELIQNDLTTDNLSRQLGAILSPGHEKETMLVGYQELKSRLGGPGASRRVAQLMKQYLIEK